MIIFELLYDLSATSWFINYYFMIHLLLQDLFATIQFIIIQFISYFSTD